MDYFSMFSGIGGFEYGIECAWRNQPHGKINRQKRNFSNASLSEDKQRPSCVGFSEIDKYAKSIYKKHYPNHTDWGDATTIKTEKLPDFQLLVGGFPCQAFSIAGKRKGFNDTRGTLFFEIARVLKDKRPRYFLLENVAGLLSHDNGKTFQTILGVLTDLGYGVEWQVLNSKDFGVPQNRERVFIVGHLGGFGGGKVFPIIGGNGKTPEFFSKVTAVSVPLRYLDRNQKNFPTDYSMCIDSSNTTGIMKEERIRRLTPVECERLQGFPDNYTKYGYDGGLISDNQRYKCLGNAVTTTVISAIVKKIVDVRIKNQARRMRV